MGHFVTSNDIPTNGEQLGGGKATTAMLAAGAIGLLLTIGSFFALGGALGPEIQASYSFSWLFAFGVFITLCIGGTFWSLLHNLANAGWGTSVRRLKENLGLVVIPMIFFTFPLVAPLEVFHPVQEVLWEWFTPHYAAAEQGIATGIFGTPELKEHFMKEHLVLLANKAWYTNIPSFYVRFACFFILVGFYIWKIRRLSVAQDTDPNPTTKRLFSARAWSATGMFFFGVFSTFLFIDFFKALDYKWFSTMWGVYMFAGCAQASMATLIITTILLKKAGKLDKVVTTEHLHTMGKLMFAFTIFWAYVAFSQFFLIWYADIPEETSFFFLRNTEEWNLVSIFLVFGHFALPFVLLLPSWVKKKTVTIVPICCWILMAHIVDLYWIVIPERGPSVGNYLTKAKENGVKGLENYAAEGPQFTIDGAFLGDIVAFLAIGLCFVALFIRNIRSANLYPNRDPRLLESANLAN